jgi:mono/diheme cytochrome c family protein
MNCHTAATGRVLGLNTMQFNGDHTYAATGRSDNQLRTLNHIGVFSQDIGAASQYAAQPEPADVSASLDARARSYLETNCSICHRPGGPTPVNMDLRYATPLADTRLVGVTNEGSVSGVRVVAGNHAGSLLWQRASSSEGSVRMPPLGVSLVDQRAMQVLADWIDSLQ